MKDKQSNSSDFFKELRASFGSKTHSIGRNDFCYCGSGRKYKKCCVSNSLERESVVSRNFEIVYEPLKEENSQDIPMVEKDQQLIEELFHMITRHPDQAQHRSDKYKTLLYLLIKKYPLKPFLWNYLTIVLSVCNEEKEMEEIIYETVNRFPDYLFGLTGLALMYIRKGELAKAFKTLKQSQSLPQLYPHRNKFHFTEVETFHHALVHYNCAVGQLDIAETHLSLLAKISTQENLLQSAMHAVALCRMKHGLFSRLSCFIRDTQGDKKPSDSKTCTKAVECIRDDNE